MKTVALSSPPTRSRTVLLVAAVGLGLLVTATAALGRPVDGWASLLVAGLFGVTIAMGGALFAAIHGVSGARWWLPIRSVPVDLARLLPVPAAVLALTFALGLSQLYPWASGAAQSPLVQEKSAWLNASFFLARALVVLLVWLGLATTMRKCVRDLGDTALPDRRASFVKASAAFVVILGPTISLAYWDWAMSLEPEWFSTMFGVYGFAGVLQGGIAATTAVALLRARRRGGLSPDRSHDLGRLLFGFSMFWAYIWFCQYLLVWYADLPEEVPHYITRLTAGWAPLFWLNVVVNFGVPFFALLGARAKRNPSALLQVALIVLAGRWLDSYLMVAPPTGPAPGFPVHAVAATVALVAGMILLYDRGAARG